MLLENKVAVVYGAGGADAVLGSGALAVPQLHRTAPLMKTRG
jgi:hypothetical protein